MITQLRLNTQAHPVEHEQRGRYRNLYVKANLHNKMCNQNKSLKLQQSDGRTLLLNRVQDKWFILSCKNSLPTFLLSGAWLCYRWCPEHSVFLAQMTQHYFTVCCMVLNPCFHKVFSVMSDLTDSFDHAFCGYLLNLTCQLQININ